MDTGGPDRPEIEVLDTERAPSAFGRWVASMMQRRAVRVVGSIAVVLVGVAVWSSVPRDDRTARAEDTEPDGAPAAVTAPGLRPPPARGRTPDTGTGSWQVLSDLAVRSGPHGHTVTFSAINRAVGGQDPGSLEVVARFVDRPRLTYRASCAAVERSPQGTRRLVGPVEQREKVLFSCTDPTRYAVQPSFLDLGSVQIRNVPCRDEEGGGAPV